MADAGIITTLARLPKKAAFTAAQIIEIYEASGRSTDTQALREAARALYPDIQEDGVPPISCTDGYGRAFLVEGEYQRPKHTLTSHFCRSVGILKDGTPLEY